MASQQIETHREGAEYYEGDAICREKYHQLLDEIHLPKGLLPLEDVLEVGYNRQTGFVWLKQKKKKQHKFKSIGRLVSYDNEVTAFVEEKKMRKVTGVQSKELLIWVGISDIYVDEKDLGTITFGNKTTGLSRSFPVSAFELEDVKK